MPAKIFAPAEERLLQIWDYTSKEWGDEQADRYLRELIQFIHSLADQRPLWRAAKVVKTVWFVRHQHHFIFFREFSSGQIGVLTVLHGNMDLPARLLEDWKLVEKS